MLNFFASLGLGVRSMQAQRAGIETAGQNLANVNNPAYARQRVILQTSEAVQTAVGWQGTGVDATAIVQLRDALVDRQIQAESSVEGFLEAQQQALQYAQSSLGEEIDRRADGAAGSAAAGGASGQAGLAVSLSDFFNSFQSLATSPSSTTERQTVLTRAATLVSRFNQVDGRLQALQDNLEQGVQQDVGDVNRFLDSIAQLNDRIVQSEFSGATANDLRDTRQEQVEQLSRLVNVEVTSQPNGSVNLSVGGELLVSGRDVLDSIETYDAGAGRMMIRTTAGATPLNLTSGSLQGQIAVRDGAVAQLREEINTVAAQLIEKTNAVHRAGFGLQGTTGADLFEGTNAADIRLNAALADNPGLIQASGVAGAAGDNQVALALAQIAAQKIPELGNQTFSDRYNQIVAEVGLSLSSTNGRITDQQLVQNMLLRQRDSVSGVSLDEEMTDLVKYQKAFEASARVITTIDEMLDTVLGLKR